MDNIIRIEKQLGTCISLQKDNYQIRRGNSLATQNQIAYTILIMRIIVIRAIISTN